MTLKTDKTPEQYQIEFAIAQLRHAYQQLHGHDGRWSRRGMKDFANGLLSPAIRTLERLVSPVVREALSSGSDSFVSDGESKNHPLDQPESSR